LFGFFLEQPNRPPPTPKKKIKTKYCFYLKKKLAFLKKNLFDFKLLIREKKKGAESSL